MTNYLAPLVVLTMWVAHAQAAEPLPAEEMDKAQVTSPAPGACRESSGNRKKNCTDRTPLQELTNKSIKESLATDPAYQAPQPPVPQLPPPPDVSPQQQQIIDDFTHLPWGR